MGMMGQQLKKSFNSSLKVGFLPFTYTALKHNNVHHMLGEGGASAEMVEKLIAIILQSIKS